MAQEAREVSLRVRVFGGWVGLKQKMNDDGTDRSRNHRCFRLRSDRSEVNAYTHRELEIRVLDPNSKARDILEEFYA